MSSSQRYFVFISLLIHIVLIICIRNNRLLPRQYYDKVQILENIKEKSIQLGSIIFPIIISKNTNAIARSYNGIIDKRFYDKVYESFHPGITDHDVFYPKWSV